VLIFPFLIFASFERDNAMKFWTLILVLAVAMFTSDAFAAKRLGGGKSVGQQSSNVTKREAATPQNTAAKPATPAAAPTPAPAAPPAAAPKRPWGAMLGGLAAGLGLAWLAHSLGLGAEMGQFLMIALVVLVAMMAIGWFMRRKTAANTEAVRSPYAFAGAGAGDASQTIETKTYNPANVGNDASARPWERQSMAFEAPSQAQQGSMIGSALGSSALDGSQTWGIPAGFDSEGFVSAAKQNFITLQAAWDKADMVTLRAMMTDEMLQEIQGQITEREKISPSSQTPTEVMMLNAQLLGIEEMHTHFMASVEFSGMIREDAATGPAPFREVWNMTKAKDGSSGWLVAGLQALQ
jgi:predicted lipid-binding transport protein (Tim44 family)